MQSKHHKRNHANLRAGKNGEAEAKRVYKSKGYNIERSGWGQDFIATRGSQKKYVEVKQGESYMTRRQLKQAKKHGRNYEVYESQENKIYRGIRELEKAGLIRRTTSR